METNAMKKLFTVLLVAGVMAGPAIAESLAGFVSDEHCGASHSYGTDNAKKCVKSCVKKGSAPVLVTDGKVMRIANPDAVKDVVGENVTIEGTVSDHTVTVASVKVAQ